MVDIRAHSLNTKLVDRTLWFDGESSYDSSKLLHLVTKYDVRFVDQLSPAVCTYNKHVPKDQEIRVKTECEIIAPEWVIPEEYKTLDVAEYLYTKHFVLTRDMNDTEADERDFRLVSELAKYEKFGLMDVLRAIIWTINTLTAKDVVWGVGRGSSVSSYVLYVIGVHDVDSFAYDLDVDDFLHV